jgi:multidrug efflux pump subunit AcrA (membrane-fusion protein)
LWSRDGAYVWRVENGKAKKVFVKVVRRDKGRVLVDGPLNEGDGIVIEGVQGLRPGQKIKTGDKKKRKGKKPNGSKNPTKS